MSRRRYIREQWETYRIILPKDVSRGQLVETRRAFFAGAAALFDVVMNNLSPGTEPQESDLQKMDDIHKELSDYSDQLRAEAGGMPKIGSA